MHIETPNQTVWSTHYISEKRGKLIKMFGSGPNMDEVTFSQFIQRENHIFPQLRCFSSWNLHQNSWRRWARKLKRTSTRKRQATVLVSSTMTTKLFWNHENYSNEQVIYHIKFRRDWKNAWLRGTLRGGVYMLRMQSGLNLTNRNLTMETNV